MAGPLDWLMPQPQRPVDPRALALANTPQGSGGLVPPDQMREQFWMPDAAGTQDLVETSTGTWPRWAAQAFAGESGTVGPDPAPRNPTNVMPEMPTAGGGKWASWIEQPGNREFLISMGLQMMTGGGDLARSLSHGFQAMAGSQQMAAREEARAARDMARPGGRSRRFPGRTRRNAVSAGEDTGLPERPRTGRYGGFSQRPVSSPAQTRTEDAADAQERRALDAASEFLQSNPTPEAWQQQNLPGGLIPAVFGGPVEYERRSELLQLTQDRQQRSAPTGQRSGGDTIMLGRGSGGREITGAELVEMLGSTDPARQAEAQAYARRAWGTPGVGHRWGVDQQGMPTRIPIGPAGAGHSQGRFEAASRAGVQAARLDIQNMRDYIKNQWPVLGQLERSGSIASNVGPFSNLRNNMRNAVAGYMHARSGAQTSVREFEHYVDTFLPQANELHYSTQAKLANLELQVMLIGRASGEPISVEELRRVHNEHRAWNGVAPVSAEEFQRVLPGLEREALSRLPSGGGAVQQQTQPQTPPVAPPTTAPAAPQAPSGGGTRENPVDVRSPDEARGLAPGTFFRTPDGRVIERR